MNYPKVNHRFKTKVSCSGGGKHYNYIREDVVNKQMRAKDKEIERLRKAFKKYGGHIPIIKDGSYKGICEYLKHSKNACNCGYEQALKEK